MIWFTADTHFGHANILKHCDRPWGSVEEHDRDLIANWNGRVNPKDTVYHLGDFCWKDEESYLSRLNGQIHFIEGNHDHKGAARSRDRFASYQKFLELKIEGQHITLCHYAMRSWYKSHYGAWHLYGHHHGALPSHGKSIDVGVDCHNYMPVSFEEVKTIMDGLEMV